MHKNKTVLTVNIELEKHQPAQNIYACKCKLNSLRCEQEIHLKKLVRNKITGPKQEISIFSYSLTIRIDINGCE
jgi:hypothetical protein